MDWTYEESAASRRRGGWRWFFAAAAGGLLFAFGLLAIASIGFLVLPVALAVVLVVFLRARLWPEPIGLAVGVAALVLLFGWGAATEPPPCPKEPVIHTPADDGKVFKCGSQQLPAWPFFLVGTAVLVGATAVFVVEKKRVEAPAAWTW